MSVNMLSYLTFLHFDLPTTHVDELLKDFMSMAEAMDTVSGGAMSPGQTSSKPTCIICLGMAGSGKTTFVQVRSMMKVVWLFNDRNLSLIRDIKG